MDRVLLILLLCFGVSIAIDESPIASFTCQLCSSGSPISSILLPPGTTCTDLDLAMQNIGRGGCSGLIGITLVNGIDITNATQVWEYAQQLQADLASEKSYANRLIIGLVGVSIGLGLTIVGAGILVYFMFKKSVDDLGYAAASRSQLPVTHEPLKFL